MARFPLHQSLVCILNSISKGQIQTNWFFNISTLLMIFIQLAYQAFQLNRNLRISLQLEEKIMQVPATMWWLWWRRQWWVAAIVLLVFTTKPVISQPRVNRLHRWYCSQYNAIGESSFLSNLNATLIDLRSQLINDGRFFATTQQVRSSNPVYALVQCRNYLSREACVACYDDAVSMLRQCSAANGARIIYDDCSFRYENRNFYEEANFPGNIAICGNETASQTTAFVAATEEVLSDLQTVTPQTDNFFAASQREIFGGNATVYAIAQCTLTISPSICQACLTTAYNNIHSCLPNADGWALDSGCFMRYSGTPFFSDNQTTYIPPFLSEGGSSKIRAIIGGVTGGVGILLLVVALSLWYQQRKKSKLARRGNILGATAFQGPMNYTFKDLSKSTKSFSEEYRVGKGGFGEVYKGILKDGNIVAVKKLAIASNGAKAEFDSEVTLISNAHHRNLIRLLGCCRKGPELLLVLEYMPNGSLDKYLYGEKQGTLNWKQRSDIIFGMARGLAYLHDQFHVTIIHRDIKSSNILLDNDFHPKIADFGLARLLPEDQTHLNTKFAGTLGYTAPEYAINGHLSEKVDTYSFGVVVLEIISGRRCTDVHYEPGQEYLLQHAWKLYEDDMHLELIDETLDPNEYKEEDVKKMIEIALMCTQSPVSLRPTMSEVVLFLSNGRPLVKRPLNGPSFIDSSRRIHTDASTSSASSITNATVTLSEFIGR